MLVEKVQKEIKEIVFVYTTCSDKAEARTLALSIIESKHAISADYWLVNSIYPWKNVIQEIDQYMIMFSTEKSKSSDLIKQIGNEHPYSIPMIVMLDTAITNHDYYFWVENTLSNKERYLTEKEYEKKKKEEQSANYGKLK